MSKTYTQEQVDKLLEKEAVKTEKAVAAATKAEAKRTLDVIKAYAAEAKNIEDKGHRTSVGNSIKELTAALKEVA